MLSLYSYHLIKDSSTDLTCVWLSQSKQSIDVLVNAAGITQDSLLFRSNHADSQSIINTNLMGTMFGCQAATQAMIKQKTKGREFLCTVIFLPQLIGYPVGCVINISSLLAVKGGRGATAYAASKAGIVGMCL